jgi:transposase
MDSRRYPTDLSDEEWRLLKPRLPAPKRRGRPRLQVEIVNRSPRPPPQKVLRIWAREWFRQGSLMDLSKLPKRPAFENLPRRWVAERTFAWISYNRRMAKDHERQCSTSEAFIHAPMARLMARRLART